MGDGTAVKEAPGFAVGIDGPTANHARIKEIKPLLARPIDLPVRFSDQHCLPLVDRDLVWTDLNLEWHDVFPWLWSLRPCLRAQHARANRCGRTEQSDDLLSDLTGRRLHVYSERILVQIGFIERIDRALQQTRRHEMAAAPSQALGDQVSAPAKVNEPYFRPIAGDDLAIGPPERGASNDPRLLLGALIVDPSGHMLEPGLAVRIRQRDSRMHFGDVRLRMEGVAFLEGPTEARSQLFRHG